MTHKTNAAYKSLLPPTTAATTRMMAARTMATILDIDDADDTNTGDMRPTTTMATNMQLTTSWALAHCIEITHPIPRLPLQASSLTSPRFCRFASPPLLPRYGARPALTPRHDTQDPHWVPAWPSSMWVFAPWIEQQLGNLGLPML
ncbi:hypothetical protein EDB83DRAFT_2317453 [Lactarius deliciosus]|nr:hypothetical protein EDB83DRAFT_2317453 [Lactarius deliciosus]